MIRPRQIQPARCAVISTAARDPSTQASVDSALDALSSARDFQSMLISDGAIDDSDLAVSDAFVLIADRAGFPAARVLMQRLRLAAPCSGVVVLGLDLIETETLELLRAGVYDFVSLPSSAGELLTRVRRVLGLLSVSAPRSVQPTLQHKDLIGRSPAFAKQLAKLPALSGCNAGVLILGETGTGKEMFAQAIHYLSARSSRPCVAVNCGAIPTDLIENELFGHARGAFTNAHEERSGLVKEAESGTLFLDEIDSLPYSAQSKLLRFLQEKEYRAVGSSKLQRADVRVIAASNKRLPEMVANGQFRQDLYFRLNVLCLNLPTLRERREDIPALALHFIRDFSHQFDRKLLGISPQALRLLVQHDWPGNVRELKHAIERAVLLANGPMLTPEDIDLDGAAQSPAIAAQESFRAAKARMIEDFERSYIEQQLLASEGNVTHAAQSARKNRRAFFQLMRKHRIEAERFKAQTSA